MKSKITGKLACAKDCAVGGVKSGFEKLGDFRLGIKGNLRLSVSEKGSETASVEFIEDGKSFSVRGLLIGACVVSAVGAVISLLDDIF